MMTSSFRLTGLTAAIVASLFIRAAAQTGSSSTVTSGASPTPHAAKVKPKAAAKAPNAHDIAWQKLIANVRSQGKRRVDAATKQVVYELTDSVKMKSGIIMSNGITLIERNTSGEKWVNAQLINSETDAKVGFTLYTVYETNGSGRPTIIHEYSTQDERDGSTSKDDYDDPPYDLEYQALFNRMLNFWANRKP